MNIKLNFFNTTIGEKLQEALFVENISEAEKNVLINYFSGHGKSGMVFGFKEQFFNEEKNTYNLIIYKKYQGYHDVEEYYKE